MTIADLAPALRAVEVWAPDLEPDGRYRPLAELAAPAVSREYAAAVCRRLSSPTPSSALAPPLRLGVSALVMGVASRLWAVSVVPAATHGVLPDPAGLVVRHDDGAVVLGVPPTATAIGAADLADAVLGVLTPLVESQHLARRLLWGNVAASLAAVPRVHGVPGATPLVEALLATPPLAGELDPAPGGSFRRRTCCLFYLAPGAGLCGDCALDHPPQRSARDA